MIISFNQNKTLKYIGTTSFSFLLWGEHSPRRWRDLQGVTQLRDKAKIPISSSVKELYFMKFKILFLIPEKWDMRLSVPSLRGFMHCRVKVYVCFLSGNRRKMKGKYLLPDRGTEATLEKSIIRQPNLWCFRNSLPWRPVEILFPADASSQVSAWYHRSTSNTANCPLSPGKKRVHIPSANTIRSYISLALCGFLKVFKDFSSDPS